MPFQIHRRRLVAAAGTVSLALAIAAVVLARRSAADAVTDALHAVALIGLFAAPWAVDRAVRRRAPALHEWVGLAAQRTGYSVTITDAQRRIVWVNDSFTRLTGYTAQDAVGRHTGELLYFERTDPATIHHVRESFAAQRGVRFEILVRGKDAREWWLDTAASSSGGSASRRT
jgi:PAS domain S-box-containing protein